MKYLFTIWASCIIFQGEAQLLAGKTTPFNMATAAIWVDTADFPLVNKAAVLLQQDIERVTGNKPPLINSYSKEYKNIIAVGSISRSAIIKQLEQARIINTAALRDKWEAYQLQTVKADALGAKGQLLVIAGSDRRGTAYGVFELSGQIGVSPWYWWADVPVKKQSALFINTAAKLADAPKVKYRGIFINDEAPALSGWTKEKFGGFNHLFYEKVFELILRLKGNYLWPAMWGNAFNTDDSLNPVLADEYGIVMGTSHHEPMLRAQQEWKKFGTGAWDYTKNDTVLRQFWKKGIEAMGEHESIVTVGMRGDGDMPMTQGTATELLEKIVTDQRTILSQVTGKPAAATPQLWALYKEVQDYYDKGMRVPDDVTLLLCDDNWGNIRRLPKTDDQRRKGGYGIYYHFDYVGGPRNYKWINTNNIARVWEQMHLAWQYKVRDIWIVNVGDIKPVEFPVSFFLEYAWNPEKIGAADLQNYTINWSTAQFGKQYAKQAAEIIDGYAKLVSRRKPEMLDAATYSLNDNEWRRVVEENNQLLRKAETLNALLPVRCRDAFFQLVLHPVKAYANLNEMYYNVALNKQAHENKWESTNAYAEKVKQLYLTDSMITLSYHALNNGKWNHMMDQKHIGYTYWQEPRVQKMPDLKYLGAGEGTKQTDTIAKQTKAAFPPEAKYYLFYELNKYISMDAVHFTKKINGESIHWEIIPGLGRTGGAVTSFPVTAGLQHPGNNTPHLRYEFYTYSKDSFDVLAYFAPTLNFHNEVNGLQYAVSIDDEQPEIISINKEDKNSSSGIWNKWVGDNVIIKRTKHSISKPGKHILKYWMVNSGVVLEKLVLDFGGLATGYLGPVETINKTKL